MGEIVPAPKDQCKALIWLSSWSAGVLWMPSGASIEGGGSSWPGFRLANSDGLAGNQLSLWSIATTRCWACLVRFCICKYWRSPSSTGSYVNRSSVSSDDTLTSLVRLLTWFSSVLFKSLALSVSPETVTPEAFVPSGGTELIWPGNSKLSAGITPDISSETSPSDGSLLLGPMGNVGSRQAALRVWTLPPVELWELISCKRSLDASALDGSTALSDMSLRWGSSFVSVTGTEWSPHAIRELLRLSSTELRERSSVEYLLDNWGWEIIWSVSWWDITFPFPKKERTSLSKILAFLVLLSAELCPSVAFMAGGTIEFRNASAGLIPLASRWDGLAFVQLDVSPVSHDFLKVSIALRRASSSDCLSWWRFSACGKIAPSDSLEEFNSRLVTASAVGFVILISVSSPKFPSVPWVVETVLPNECWLSSLKDCCSDTECSPSSLTPPVSLSCLSLFNTCWTERKFGPSSFDTGLSVSLSLFSWGACLRLNSLTKAAPLGAGGTLLVIISSGVALSFRGCERTDVSLPLSVASAEPLGTGFFWTGGVTVCCVLVNVLLTQGGLLRSGPSLPSGCDLSGGDCFASSSDQAGGTFWGGSPLDGWKAALVV